MAASPMDFGTLLRGLGVLRPVLALMGRWRVALLLSVVISLGWFFLSAGRADASTGGTLAGTGIIGTFGPSAVVGFAVRVWVVGTALALGLILGALAVWITRAESDAYRAGWADAGHDDGSGDGRVFGGYPVRHDDFHGVGGGGPRVGPPTRGPGVGAPRHDVGA